MCVLLLLFPVLISLKMHRLMSSRNRTQMMPLDEVSVLELLDPIPDPAAVLSMCAYLGIKIPTAEDSTTSMINWESHLVWVAKLAVLDELPDGWEEVITEADENGEYNVQYIKKDGDEQLLKGEHPNDDSYRKILARERSRRAPKQVLFREMYEYGAIRFRRDVTLSAASSRNVSRSGARVMRSNEAKVKGIEEEERLVPALGLYIDLYDSTGTKYFYHVLSGAITYDINVVRREPAALIIQRNYRGYRERSGLQMTSVAARRIQACWRTFKYRRALRLVSLSQAEAARIIQRCWRTHAMSVRASRECFRKLAELKQARRPGRIDYSKVSGLMSTKKTFRNVLRMVINVQRHVREIQARKRAGAAGIKPAAETSLMVENFRREEQRLNALQAERREEERAATCIQAAFRGMHDRRRVAAMRRSEEDGGNDEQDEMKKKKKKKTDDVAAESRDAGADGGAIEDESGGGGGGTESGRATPLPERKIVTLMNEKAAARPKSRGKTPKSANGSKLASSGGGGGGGDDVPQPSKTESGAEVLVLSDVDDSGANTPSGGDDMMSPLSPAADAGRGHDWGTQDTNSQLSPAPAGIEGSGSGEETTDAKRSKRTKETRAGDGSVSGSHATASKNTAKDGKDTKVAKKSVAASSKPRLGSSRKKKAAADAGAPKSKADSSKAAAKSGTNDSSSTVIDNTVSTRTKLKAPTPRAARKAKPPPVDVEPPKPFGRSTIVAAVGVKQIKIGSLFVSPIGAVKRTQTPEKMISAGTDHGKSSGRGGRPKTPSRMRSAKKKLDVDAAAAGTEHANGGGEGNGAAAPLADTSKDVNENGIGVSYPSPSSSRATSRASSRDAKKKSRRKKPQNAAGNADEDDDDADLFQKIKEQRLRTETILLKNSSTAATNLYTHVGIKMGKTSPTRRLNRRI